MNLDVGEIIGGKDGEDDVTVYRAFREVFESDAGKVVIRHLCRESGLFARASQTKMLTTEQLWFLAGKQELARWILAVATVPPPAPKAPAPEVSPLDKVG